MLLRDPFRTSPGPPAHSGLIPSSSASLSPSPSPPAATQAWCTLIVQTVGLLVRSTATMITTNSTGILPPAAAKNRARGVKASPGLRANQEPKRKSGSLGVVGVLDNHPPYQSMCRVLSQLTRATVNNHHNAWSWQGT